jgi:hypothetical protein
LWHKIYGRKKAALLSGAAFRYFKGGFKLHSRTIAKNETLLQQVKTPPKCKRPTGLNYGAFIVRFVGSNFTVKLPVAP